MSKQIKWKFKSTDIYFVSEERSLTRDVMRQRERLKLKPTTKIEIINEFFTTDGSTTTGCSSCGSNTSNQEQPTLPVGDEGSGSNGDETSGLQSVSDVLDLSDDNSSVLEDTDSTGDSDSWNSFINVDLDGQVD